MKRILSLSLLLLLTLSLAACNNGSETEETKDTTSVDKTTDTDNTTDTATEDQEFLYVAQQLVGTIDPAAVKDETEVITAINLYDPLFYPDVENNSMAPMPHVAASYEVSEDGLVYTIQVRDDITFQSGNPLTAADVAYSMTRMLAINKGNANLWSAVMVSAEATDATTVVFTLNSAYAPFISSLTQLFIVDSELLKANQEAGDFGDNGDYGQAYIADNAAGSGPYTLTEWNRQSYLKFEAFEDYWKGWSEGQIKKAQMLTITEEATVKTLLASGEADMVHQWLNVSAFNEFKTLDGIVVEEAPSVKLQYFPMNTQKAPTDDVNVRKAIAYAIDYTTALEDILGGAQPAAGPVPSLVPGHSDNVEAISQDLDVARAALAASKYAGQDITVDFMYLGETVEQKQFMSLVTANLAEIGITVNPIPVAWAQVTEAAASPEATANLTVISDTLKYPHVDSHTYGIFALQSAGSYRSMAWYENDELEAILNTARTATTPAEQLAAYAESQDIVAADYTGVFLANPTHRIAYSDQVEGYTFVGLMGYDIAFYSLSMK